jgi:uncharacterized protein YycO
MRPVLKVGDILLCRRTGNLISRLISAIEHCPFSHVAWVVDADFAVEALGRGVSLTPLKDFDWGKHKHVRVVRIKPGLVTPGQMGGAVWAARSQVGKRYDWLLILKLAWAWAFKRRHAEPQEGSRRAWICSELIAEPLWANAKFRFRDDVVAENTAPKDIAISKKVDQVWP